jgi:hypothetical protein
MVRTETAGFPPKSYETLPSGAGRTVDFQRKIKKVGIVQGRETKTVRQTLSPA